MILNSQTAISKIDVTKAPKENDNVTNIIDSYTIQLLEDERRKNGLKLQYYFDNADIINIIKGITSYIDFDYEIDLMSDKYQNEKNQNLIYAFAYKGFYNWTTIKMLDAHKVEFFTSVRGKSILESLMPKNKLQKEIENLLLKIRNEHANTYVGDLATIIRESGEIFRIIYLLGKMPSIPNRLKFLIENEIIDLDDTIDEEGLKINNIELFKLAIQTFKDLRPGKERTKATNNFYDALALCNLQDLLDAHIESNGEHPLPVFYASTSTMSKVVKIIREKKPEWLAYKTKEIPEPIPIVRDYIFFLLEPIFSPEKKDSTDSFFNRLIKDKTSVKTLLDKEYKKAFSSRDNVGQDLQLVKVSFERNIREIIETKFTKELWSRDNRVHKEMYADLEILLQEVVAFTQSKRFENDIESYLKATLRNARENLERSKRLSSIINSFRSFQNDFNRTIGDKIFIQDFSVYRDFALIKFGIDSEKMPHLQEFIENLINHSEELNESSPILYNTLSAMAAKVDSPEKADSFLDSITLAWLMDKRQLIIDLCKRIDFNNKFNRYEIALIYATSIITNRQNRSGILESLEIIKCIKKKKNNYKLWIGYAYLYYRMWEIENEYFDEIPDMNLNNWKKYNFPSQEYKEYYEEGAKKYIVKAYDHLKEQVEKDGAKKVTNDKMSRKNIAHLISYLYTLNNLIYYTTKSGSEKEFEDLKLLVKEFKKYEIQTEYWQGRFYDTLGWYSLRKSFHISQNYRNRYTEQAINYYEKAKKSIASMRDLNIFEQLMDAIANS